MSSTIQPETGNPTGVEEATGDYACPVCDRIATDQDAIYRHLLVNHRKSVLSERLLETTSQRRE